MKKTITTVIITLILVCAGIGLYMYVRRKKVTIKSSSQSSLDADKKIALQNAGASIKNIGIKIPGLK